MASTLHLGRSVLHSQEKYLQTHFRPFLSTLFPTQNPNHEGRSFHVLTIVWSQSGRGSSLSLSLSSAFWQQAWAKGPPELRKTEKHWKTPFFDSFLREKKTFNDQFESLTSPPSKTLRHPDPALQRVSDPISHLLHRPVQWSTRIVVGEIDIRIFYILMWFNRNHIFIYNHIHML